VILRLPTIVASLVVGAALLLSACTTGSTNTPPGPSRSAAPSSTAGTPSIHAGPNPCRLITAHDISSVLKESVVKASGSRSTCSYVNGSTTDNVVITTSKSTQTIAKRTVDGSVHLAKVKVHHLSGIGNTAIAFLRKSKGRATATCMFAKSGTVVIVLISSPHAKHILPWAIALAKRAASVT